MQQGHGQAAWTWKWGMEWPCNMDKVMQHGYGYGHAAWAWTWTWTWTCKRDMDIEHGHGHAAWTWTCSMDNGHWAGTWTCSRDMDSQHRHSINMEMQHENGHVAWTWTCSIDNGHVWCAYTAQNWTCGMNKNMGIQHRRGCAAWTRTRIMDMDVQHGHIAWTKTGSMDNGHVSWTCTCNINMDMQHEHRHRHTAWTWILQVRCAAYLARINYKQGGNPNWNWLRGFLAQNLLTPLKTMITHDWSFAEVFGIWYLVFAECARITYTFGHQAPNRRTLHVCLYVKYSNNIY